MEINNFYISISIMKLSNDNHFGFSCLIKRENKEIKLITESLKNETSNRIIMIGLIKSIEWIKSNFKDIDNITFHCNSLLLSMPFKMGKCIKLINDKTKNGDLWGKISSISSDILIHPHFEENSSNMSSELMKTKSELRKLKYRINKKNKNKVKKRIDLSIFKDEKKLSEKIYKQSFLKKEGDAYNKVIPGEMYEVLEYISNNSVYGFANKISKSVIKFKKISQKQAHIIAKTIVDYNIYK